MLVSTIPLGVGSLQAVIWAQDISERKQAEEKLHESQTRLAAVLAESEAARSLSAAVFTAQTDPIMVCGADGIVMRTNPAANDTWGFDPTGRHFTDVMAKLGIPGGLGASLTQRALNGETIVNEEQKAGERILETSSAPMRDSEGRIIGAVVVPRDVTRRQQMREALLVTVRELESALGEKTVLLKEVHHRVKNNLAVISSLLNMKAEATGIDETRQALADSQQRVRSIALIHEHLYGRKYLNLINFAEYTQELLQELVQIQVSDPGRIVIQSNVQRIEMGVHRAVPCALIFNELVSNAFKHAFPGERRGRVRVGFGESQPGFLELSVEDNGIGCPACAGEGETKSLGLRIVHILARQLDGTFRQEPCAGTRFVLRFPAGSSRRI